MAAHGRQNLTFCAFTATHRRTRHSSVRQRDAERFVQAVPCLLDAPGDSGGFILNPLDHYVAYSEAVEIAKTAR